jgi:hypothetical protein
MRGIAFLVPYLQPALSSVSLVNTMGNVSRERMHPLRVPTRLGVEREETELSSYSPLPVSVVASMAGPPSLARNVS